MADELLTRLRQWADEDWVQRLAIGDPTEDGYRLSHDIRAAVNALADRDRRIEALTKALRALTGCTKEVTNALKACAMFTITDQAARQIALKMVKEGEEAADTANALLASAAGAEGEA